MGNKNFRSLMCSFTHKLIDSFAARPIPFKVMFDRFRQVLEYHNKAIEIIADMGDKLGGDYIFDVTYIRGSYAVLYDTLSESLANFDVLTRNKYPRVKDALRFIDQEIRLHVYDEYSPVRQLVLPYTGLGRNMVHEVGGKNANLAELKNNAGINIPEAFAITTYAYDEFMTHNGIDKMISALGGDAADAKPALDDIYTSVIEGSVPRDLQDALDKALSLFRAKYGNNCFLAVRSSAEAEDGEFSFAGQFDTILNVPLDNRAVQEAYKQVLASLFSDRAAAYHSQAGSHIGNIKMAVACLVMVDAAASGVAYSTNPNGDDGTVIINSAWGLGTSVVEGLTDADFYRIRKGPVPVIADERCGKKASMVVSREGGGITTAGVPDAMAGKSSLSSEQALELGRQAEDIENYFRQPQDIEWAIDKQGKIFILQARPLRIAASGVESQTSGVGGQISSYSILMTAKGQVVQKGVGAGRVFIFKHRDGMDKFLRGDVLVAKNDSSDFIRLMPYASAMITDTGSLTSHMASLCREFRVPAFVNAGSATQVLRHGQEVTIVIDDEDSVTVYDGILRGVIERARSGQTSMEDIFEFRKKRYALRYITPLNLIDPLMEKFTPEGCKTIHDILRFIHEKAVMELIDNAVCGLKGQAAKKLDLPIPAGIIVVDIGGGLDRTVERQGVNQSVTLEQIESIPFRAILQGMIHPGAWQSSPVALKLNDFLTSMMRMPDIASGNAKYPGSNIAVISREYLNMTLRFGYHFNMIDCYCSEKARNNHIYFRFTGGATDMVKRSRRIELISIILKEYGFNTTLKGDLIIGRLANIERSEQENKLDHIGRLISYTRQLDAILHDDAKVEYYARRFLEGNYEL
ncbi:MAG: hypothetical protein HQL09_00630 [Nitrospirae bacterium]|nr:hypothetical protein [Nitrospirota bacterium]